jgi:O-antigen/teichoic acid export membrane protein
MSKARGIVKNTMVLVVARVIERISGLVLVLFISRELGADGLGVYSAAIAFYSLIAIAGEAGATNLLVREIAKDPARTNRYVVHLGVMAVVLSLLIMGVAWLVVSQLGYASQLQTAFLVVALALMPGTLNTIQEAVFVAHQRVEFQTLGTFVSALITIALTVYLLSTGSGVIGVLVAFVIVQWAVTFVYFGFINRYITPLRWEFSFSVAREMGHEIKTFAGLSILAATFAQPEILLLAILSTEAQTGYYSAALKIVNLWYIVSQTFMINVFPVLSRLTHEGDERARLLHEKAIKYLLATALPAWAFMVAAAEPLILLFYGTGFGPSVDDLRIMAVCVPLYSVNAVLWRTLVARGRQDAVLRVLALNVVIRLVAGVLLIVALASLGAAIVTSAILVLYSAMLAGMLHREGIRLRLAHVATRFAIASAVMGGLVWIMSDRLPVLVLVLIAAVVYAGLVLLVRGFSADDKAIFRSVLRVRAAR